VVVEKTNNLYLIDHRYFLRSNSPAIFEKKNAQYSLIFSRIINFSGKIISGTYFERVSQQWKYYFIIPKKHVMPKWLRALIAGYGAKKLGGGCLSTILIFIVIYYALGTCNRPASTPRRADVNSGHIKTVSMQRPLLMNMAFLKR
jgi:hypothetical protein